MTKCKVPKEWAEQHREKTVDGKKAIEGVLSSGTGIVGDFVEVEGMTVLTICNAQDKGAEWFVRVLAPAPLADCLEAAVLAAQRVGAVER